MKGAKPTFILILLLTLAFTTIFSFLGLWVSRAFVSPMAIERPEIPYSAQVARNVSRGEGFTTDVIFPIAIHRFGTASKHPDLLCPPLYTLLLALAMKMMPSTDWTLIVCSFFFYIVSIVALYFLVYRIFDIRVAFLSCFFYTINGVVINEVALGSDANFATAIFTILILSLYTFKPKTLLGGCIPGIVLGLFYLARYTSILFLPAVCWYIYRASSENKWKNLLLCLASFLLVISPWLLRNLIVASNPFFTYARITQISNSGMANLLTDTGGWVYGSIGGFNGLVARLAGQLKEWTFVTWDFMSPLFLLAILHGFENERFEKIRQLVYLLILIVIGQQLIYRHANPYVIFYPFVIMVGVAYFLYLIEKVAQFGRRTRAIAVVCLVAINLLPLVYLFYMLTRWPGAHSRDDWELLVGRVKEEKPLISDVAPLISWFEDRTVIMLPPDIDGLNTVVKGLNTKPAILLSDVIEEYPRAVPDIPWYRIRDKAEEGVIDRRLGLGKGAIWDNNFLFF